MYVQSNMECAAGTDKIKVTPQGCKPVSEDRCASGFMAPAENVTFPKNPLETCCKCKEGETCAYCLGEECTEAEKKKYVTDKDCFEEPKEPEEPEETVDVSPDEEDDGSMFPEWFSYVIYIALLGLIYAVYMMTPGGSPFKKQIMIFGGIVTIVGGILLAFVGPGIKLSNAT